jgi:hypothetical protein
MNILVLVAIIFVIGCIEECVRGNELSPATFGDATQDEINELWEWIHSSSHPHQ